MKKILLASLLLLSTPAFAEFPAIGQIIEAPIFICLERKDVEDIVKADLEGKIEPVTRAKVLEGKCGPLAPVRFRIREQYENYTDSDGRTFWLTQVEISWADKWQPAYTLAPGKAEPRGMGV